MFGVVPSSKQLNTLRTMTYEAARVALGHPSVDIIVARVGDAFVYAVKDTWPYGNYTRKDIESHPLFIRYVSTIGRGEAPPSTGFLQGSWFGIDKKYVIGGMLILGVLWYVSDSD